MNNHAINAQVSNIMVVFSCSINFTLYLIKDDPGNSILYSRCVYGKASHMRDFPYCVKFMMESHIFGVREIW